LKDIEVCANTCDAWKSIASEGFQVIFLNIIHLTN
jgi:hypothetical protein